MAHRTLEQWRQIIEAQKSSGMSIVEFCHQSNINEKSFYNRRAKLGLNTDLATPAFIKAEPVKPDPQQAISLTCGKAILTLPSAVSPQWLAELLRGVA